MQHRQTTTPKSPSTMKTLNGGIEQRLLAERRQVIQEIFAQALNANNSMPNLQDHDYAQLSQMRDLEYSRRESLNRRLGQLDDALGRVHSGLYGICLECGAGIAETRLAADPAAPLCVGCQAGSETVVPQFTL